MAIWEQWKTPESRKAKLSITTLLTWPILRVLTEREFKSIANTCGLGQLGYPQRHARVVLWHSCRGLSAERDTRMNWFFPEKLVWLVCWPSHLIFLLCSYQIQAPISHNPPKSTHMMKLLISFFADGVFCFLADFSKVPYSLRSRCPPIGGGLKGETHTVTGQTAVLEVQGITALGSVGTWGPSLQWICVPDEHGALSPAMHRTADIPITFHCNKPCTGILKFLNLTIIYPSCTQAEPLRTKWLNLFYRNRQSGQPGRSQYSSTVSQNQLEKQKISMYLVSHCPSSLGGRGRNTFTKFSSYQLN